jgi:hypothetical protein
MTSLSDQLSAVRKSQWEAQLDIFDTLTNRALDSAGQLIDLQLRASRTSVEQVTGTFKQLLDATSPRDFVAVGSRAQGQWHYLFSYSRELFGIASGLRTDTWSSNPAASASVLASPLLITAPTANVPTSVTQALEQASIATAGATTLHSEIAAAAVDTGAALAEATLHAGTEAVQQAAEAQQQASQPEQNEEEQPEQKQSEAAPLPESAAEAAVHFAEAASDTAIADAVPPVAETPLAQALHEIAPPPASAQHPLASTLPLEAQDGVGELPHVVPVDAEPPAPVPVPPTPPKASRGARRSK